jgi:hypothetical protein
MSGSPGKSKMSLTEASRHLASEGKITGNGMPESRAKRLRDRYQADKNSGN